MAAAMTDRPSEGAEPNSWLWSAFARSVRDNMVAELLVQALRVGGIVVLARALSPHDFGLFKILVVVSTFAMLINEAGVPDALIQRRDLTRAHHTTAWWMSVGLALVTASILYGGAPALASVMKMPELREGVRLLCIPFLLEGAAVTANARLRRDLRFGPLAVADVFGEIAFLVVALGLLWNGLPVWSLAAGLAARFGVHATTILIAGGRSPLGLPTMTAARDLTHFATRVLGGRIVDALAFNIDFILIGRLLGSTALGYYAMAWDLLRFVPDRVFRVAGRVTLPAFCHLQDQTDQLARAYLNFCGYLSRIILPIVLCAAIAAPELIRTIYGPKWVPAAVPMQLLASGLLLVGLRLAIGSVYYAKNHPEFDFYIHTTGLVLVILTVFGLASSGLAAVSLGRSMVEAFISIIGMWLSCVLLDIGLREMVVAILPGVRLAMMCALAVVAGKMLASFCGTQGVATLMLVVVPPALVYCWRESSTAMKMLADALGRGQTSPIAVVQEMP
ncbi:MAG TPA: lipopolysaccharide biosynthesis protein [Candidatus Binatus sp.]|nr:lipopolysaccharide biosynthesis protein [Candidatus Binatus sp.]